MLSMNYFPYKNPDHFVLLNSQDAFLLIWQQKPVVLFSALRMSLLFFPHSSFLLVIDSDIREDIIEDDFYIVST